MVARLVFCVLLLLAVTSAARADTSAAVLGLRSLEGDDELANDLTEQLRSASRAVEGWSVSSTAVSMAQMSLAHGCDEIDASCLSEIAKGLKADRIIYGTIRRTSARDDYDFALSLYLFDAETSSIARQVEKTMTRNQTDFQSLAAVADKLVARLSSTATGGGVEIQANVSDAEVTVNGQSVGVTHDGALHLTDLQPGKYRIEIHKEGYTPNTSTVSVVEGADASITAVLSPLAAPNSGVASTPHEGHHLAWLGWSLIGLSVASLAGTGVSLAIVDGVNHDPLYLKYRGAVYLGNQMAQARNLPQDVVHDVCTAADNGSHYTLTPSDVSDVRSKCHTAATFEVLQWVFLGAAIASGATGTYLVLTADPGKGGPQEEGEALAQPPRLSLRPAFGPGSAQLSATLRF
jgi:hypothetical protein